MPPSEETVEAYSFTPDDLAPEKRSPGISAFMRIRNGEEFLETAVRSHIAHFDEIVAVYNQSTDATPGILARLAQEYGPKLRIFHYVPKVYPPGSEGHMREPAGSPHSFVNMSNFALARTRHSVIVKLDDDHLAMEPELTALMRRARRGISDEMLCFSGPNIARNAAGQLGILATTPFSGNGDIGFFAMSRDSFFRHDLRFEHFRHGRGRRRFVGFAYWHLKYLKRGLGFANYDLEANPGSRFARRWAAFPADPPIVSVGDLPSLSSGAERVAIAARKLGLPLPEKLALIVDRWIAAEKLGREELPAIMPALTQPSV